MEQRLKKQEKMLREKDEQLNQQQITVAQDVVVIVRLLDYMVSTIEQEQSNENKSKFTAHYTQKEHKKFRLN